MIEVGHAPYRGYGPNCFVTREDDFARLEEICRKAQIELELKASGLGAYFTINEKHVAWFRMMVDVRSV